PLHLVDDHLDLAVRIGSLPDSSLVAVQVGRIRSVVCASPSYLDEHGVPRSPKDLAAHACISFTTLAEMEFWSFGAERIRVRSRLSVNTAESAVDAAVAGVGLTRVLSYQAAEA